MKNTKLGKDFFKRLLKDTTVRMHYEEESSKTAIAFLSKIAATCGAQFEFGFTFLKAS